LKPVHQYLICFLLGLSMFLAQLPVQAQATSLVQETEQPESTDTLIEAIAPTAEEPETAVGKEKEKEVVDLYEKRTVPEKQLKKWRNDPEYAYANDPEYWEPEAPPSNRNTKFTKFLANFFNSDLIKILFYLALIGLGFFTIYRLVVEQVFFSKKSELNLEEQSSNDEALLTLDTIEAAIQGAEQLSDFKKAVRLLYIQTLLMMDRKKWIQFNANATNTEYLIKLNKAPFFKDFDVVTNIYEYVFFGGFDVNRSQFEQIRERFLQLQNSLKR